MVNSIVVSLPFHLQWCLGENERRKTVSCAITLLVRYRDHIEIRQSTKYFKKYDRNNYKLEIKRCTLDDKGEYTVRATNSFGEKEYAVFLTVEGN